MSSNPKMFKISIVTLMVLVAGFLVIDKVILHSGFEIWGRSNLELSWKNPAENVDSSPLTELAGYTIHCWNAEDQITETIVVQNPTITTYELDHLWPGTYQCAISATNINGDQSVLSNVVTRVVQ